MTCCGKFNNYFRVERANPLSVCRRNGLDEIMNHVRSTIEELRRYIATCDAHDDLMEVDTLLAVALEEVRRKLTAKQKAEAAKRS